MAPARWRRGYGTETCVVALRGVEALRAPILSRVTIANRMTTTRTVLRTLRVSARGGRPLSRPVVSGQPGQETRGVPGHTVASDLEVQMRARDTPRAPYIADHGLVGHTLPGADNDIFR